MEYQAISSKTLNVMILLVLDCPTGLFPFALASRASLEIFSEAFCLRMTKPSDSKLFNYKKYSSLMFRDFPISELCTLHLDIALDIELCTLIFQVQALKIRLRKAVKKSLTNHSTSRSSSTFCWLVAVSYLNFFFLF